MSFKEEKPLICGDIVLMAYYKKAVVLLVRKQMGRAEGRSRVGQ